MILWTIQPMQVYEDIMKKGFYHCDFRLSMMNEYDVPYNWLVRQMNKRIGAAPNGVTYPVWAWHTWEGVRKKPDLRKSRFGYGEKGDKFACLELEIEEAKEIFQEKGDYVIVDVRRPDEFAEGHISGAINIPNESIAEEPSELPDKTQTIYVYCRSGNRSKDASQKLAELGYTSVVDIGGILDWIGEIEKE